MLTSQGHYDTFGFYKECSLPNPSSMLVIADMALSDET